MLTGPLRCLCFISFPVDSLDNLSAVLAGKQDGQTLYWADTSTSH